MGAPVPFMVEESPRRVLVMVTDHGNGVRKRFFREDETLYSEWMHDTPRPKEGVQWQRDYCVALRELG